jgi:hypothetical protein
MYAWILQIEILLSYTDVHAAQFALVERSTGSGFHVFAHMLLYLINLNFPSITMKQGSLDLSKHACMSET